MNSVNRTILLSSMTSRCLSSRFVNIKNLIEVELNFALSKIIDPYHLHLMDLREVEMLVDALEKKKRDMENEKKRKGQK